MNLKQILEVERDTMDDPHPDFDFDPITPIRNMNIVSGKSDLPWNPSWLHISPDWEPGNFLGKNHSKAVPSTWTFRRMHDVPYMSKKDMFVAIEEIKSSCNEILSIYNSNEGRVFYRGSKFSRGKFSYFLHPSTSRSSRDTPGSIDSLVNHLMAGLGFKALRENSFFVSPEFEMATNYGLPCVCFPFDGFKYTWSKTEKDFYNSLNKESVAIFHDNYKSMEEKKKWFMEKYQYQSTEIDKALYFKNEVMISAPCVFIPYIYHKAIQKYLVPSYEFK